MKSPTLMVVQLKTCVCNKQYDRELFPLHDRQPWMTLKPEWKVISVHLLSLPSLVLRLRLQLCRRQQRRANHKLSQGAIIGFIIENDLPPSASVGKGTFDLKPLRVLYKLHTRRCGNASTPAAKGLPPCEFNRRGRGSRVPA